MAENPMAISFHSHKQREIHYEQKPSSATLSLAVLTSGTFAFADQRDEQQALAQSKISATEAVAIAEKQAARAPTILNST